MVQKSYLRYIAMLLAIATLFVPVMATAEPIPEPADVTMPQVEVLVEPAVGVGESFTVSFEIRGPISDICSVEVDLTFDTTLLEVEVPYGGTEATFIEGTLFQHVPYTVTANTVNNATGEVHFAQTLDDSSQGVGLSSEYVISSIGHLPVMSKAEGSVYFDPALVTGNTRVILKDSSGQDIPYTLVGAHLQIMQKGFYGMLQEDRVSTWWAPVQNAIVTLIDNGSTVLRSTVTDANGFYIMSTVGLAEGTYVFVISKDGFETTGGLVDVTSADTVHFKGISFIKPAGIMKVVVSWSPDIDLDTHMVIPSDGTNSSVALGYADYNLYEGFVAGDISAYPWAELLGDAWMESKETVVISQLVPGVYSYRVHNADDYYDSLLGQTICADVYDSDNHQIAHYDLPTTVQTANSDWWHVFDILVEYDQTFRFVEHGILNDQPILDINYPPLAPGNLAVTGGVINFANMLNVEVTGIAEPGSTVNVTIGNRQAPVTVAAADGSFATHLNVNGIAEGATIITATATNTVGISAPATITVLTDTYSPGAEIRYSTLAPTNGDVLATLRPDETVTVTNNNGSLTYNFTHNGTFTFEFVDVAGNTNTATATVSNIDKDVPAAPTNLAVTGGVINAANAHSVQFTGSAEPGTNVVVKAGTVVLATTTPGDGNFTINLNLTSLQDGNVAITATVRDMAGNIGPAASLQVLKDTVAPTATISYSTTEPTTSPVVATLVTSESDDVLVTNNSGSKTYTFTQNGSFTFEFRDVAGNTGTAIATVSNIELSVPAAPTNLAVTGGVINQFNAAAIEVTGLAETGTQVEVSVGGITESTTAAADGSFSVQVDGRTLSDGQITISATATNVYGASDSATIVVTKDTVAPTAIVNYSTLAPTRQDVNATLVNPSETITVTNNEGSITYTFSENGSFTFEFRDTAGNTGSAIATVSNIDKQAPAAPTNLAVTGDCINLGNYYSVEITGTAEAGTNVTVTAHGVQLTVTATDGSFSVVLDLTPLDDGDVTITAIATDMAGNVSPAAEITVPKDVVAPTATVSYSTTDTTDQPVVATLQPSETVTVTNNNGLSAYTFTRNGSFTFEFKDAVGNTGTATAAVSNIELPVPAAPTDLAVVGGFINQANVSAILVTGSAQPGSRVDVYLGGIAASTTAQLDSSFQVTINGSSLVDGSIGIAARATDENGTSNSANITVTRDTVAPTAAVSCSTTNLTNQDVVVTITPSETVTVTNNNGELTYTFTENGSFTFELVDRAGNTGSVAATVDNIDKVAPTAIVAYSTTAPTNQDVVATITPSEAVTVTNNDGELTYTFTENGSFAFEFVDAAGNTGSVVAEVNNIDKTPPAALIIAPTEGQVIATSTVTVTGTCSEPCTVQVSCSGITRSVSTTGPDNTYSTTANLGSSGQHSIAVIAFDQAGNSSDYIGVQVDCTYVPPVVVVPPAEPHLPTIAAGETITTTSTEDGATTQTITTTVTLSSSLLQAAGQSARQGGVPVTIVLPPAQENDPAQTPDGREIVHATRLVLTDSQLENLPQTGLRIEGLGTATLELPPAVIAAIAAANTGLTIDSFGVPAAHAQTSLNPWDEVCFAQEIETDVTGATILRWPAPQVTNLDDLHIRIIHGDGSVEDLTPEIVTINEQQYLQITVHHFSMFIVYTPGQEPVIPQIDEIVLTIGQLAMTVNGEISTLDVAPFIDSSANRTLVPLRFITEALGADVRWFGNTKQVRINDGDNEIILTIGSKTMLVNGQAVAIDAAPQITGSRTFVPLRSVSELLGADVQWLPGLGQIVIRR